MSTTAMRARGATSFNTLTTVDAMLIGGASYKEYFDYWASVPSNPKADANERKFAENHRPHSPLCRVSHRAVGRLS